MFRNHLEQHKACFATLDSLETVVVRAGRLMAVALERGNKIMGCGNGGSAADAQHFAAELVGRFDIERRAYAAIALTTDTSILTAISNDYAFENIFVRQLEGLAKPGDVLLGISTSGNSVNLMKAFEQAKKHDITTVGLLGRGGGRLKDLSDIAVVISSKYTPRIQEAHVFVLHFWTTFIEQQLAG